MSQSTIQEETKATATATTTSTTTNPPSHPNLCRTNFPCPFVDAHHHFIDTVNNRFQQQFLAKLVPNEIYLPEQYQQDVIQRLSSTMKFMGSVHVECLPDDGVAEAQWVESLNNNNNNNHTVKAIVASCDLTRPDVETELQRLDSISLVRGIRWILDWDGPYQPGSVTHVATTRHTTTTTSSTTTGSDNLRGHDFYDGKSPSARVYPPFERGYAFLSQYNLSFDLQCAPAQLMAAASLCAKYPTIPVCIDHLGKPCIRSISLHELITTTRSSSSTSCIYDTVLRDELDIWSQGMQAMAKLPHVYVKISMLGYILPGWSQHPESIAFMKQLVQQVVTWFTPQRCMVALNWWKSSACSDSDGLSSHGPTPDEFVQYIYSFFSEQEGYSQQDQESLFCNTARTFYRF